MATDTRYIGKPDWMTRGGIAITRVRADPAMTDSETRYIAAFVPKARLNPRARRERWTCDVELFDGSAVQCVRIGFDEMALTHLIPPPRLMTVLKQIWGLATEAEAVAALHDEVSVAALLNLLRRQAVACAVDPVITLTDDGDPDHLPADLIEMDDLVRIWMATAYPTLREAAREGRFHGLGFC
jgi:hypothetical protein